MYWSKEDIINTNKIKRLNLINSVSGTKSANLIGSKSESGQENLAIFSSVIHLGSNPALLGFVLRPDKDVRRHTYDNIIASESYTINSIHASFIDKAHYTSAKFSVDESEFEKCKLEAQYLNEFNAPFVKASKLKMALTLQEVVDIKINSCKLIIGSIEHLHVDQEAIEENGQVNLQKLDTVAIGGLNSYYALNQIGHFPYARTSELPDFD
jgi:flavin reductase (DIM6/NTAB) family NADH-FMN oxidoreductase RutF